MKVLEESAQRGAGREGYLRADPPCVFVRNIESIVVTDGRGKGISVDAVDVAVSIDRPVSLVGTRDVEVPATRCVLVGEAGAEGVAEASIVAGDRSTARNSGGAASGDVAALAIGRSRGNVVAPDPSVLAR